MAESLKQQQQRIKLEQEYQAALSFSASLNAKLTKDLEDQANAAGDLSNEMKSFVNDLSSSVSGLSDSASITKEILKLESQQKTLAASITSENRALVLEKKFALDTAIEALRVEEKILQNTEQVDKRAKEYADTIGGWFDGVARHAAQVPLLGGLLGGMAQKVSTSIKDKLGTATKQFVVDFRAGMEGGKSQAAGLANAVKKSGGSVFKALFSWKILLLGIIGLFALSVMALDKAEKAQIAFREETGIIDGQFAGLNSKVASVAGATYGMTGDLEQGAKLAGQMYNAFGGVEDVSLGVLTNATKLAAGLGISMDAIGGVNKLFQNAFGSSQQLAQSMVNTTVEASTLAGVPADRVLKDMAESSEEVYKYFRGSPQALQKSAIQAAKLGTSIKKAADSAKSLLNFEDSINSELEASAIIGRNLNFNQARSLAANGDILGSQKAILKEVGKLGDLSKLNVYQQEALEKATGMTIGDMVNQQRISKNLGQLDAERMKKANELISAGADASKLTKDQIDKALKQEKVDNQRATTLQGIQRTIESIMLKLGEIFMPEVEGILAWLKKEENIEKVKSFIEGMKKGFGEIKEALMKAYNTVKPALEWISDKLGMNSGGVGGSAEGAGKKIVVFGAILMGLKTALPIISALISGIGSIGGGMLSMAGKTQTATTSSESFLQKLGKGIGAIGKGIGDAVRGIASGLGAAMKSLGSGIGQMIRSMSKGIGGALGAIGQGLGVFLRGMSGGLQALANPKALLGLAAIVAAFYFMAEALAIMAPALEPLGKMFKSIFEGIASIVVPIIDILVNGFVRLAEVIGGTIIGIINAFVPIVDTMANAFVKIGEVVGGVILGYFETFASVVQTLADAFVRIAEIVGNTLVGIFTSINDTLSYIIENSGKASEITEMAIAIGKLGAALLAFGVGAGGGAAASGIGNAVGALGNAFASAVSGEEAAPTGPIATMEKLISLGPALATFSSMMLMSLNNFDLFISKIPTLITPIMSLVAALNMFTLAMFGVGEASKNLDVKNIGNITGMANAAVSVNAKLPELVSNLADKIAELTGGGTKTNDNPLLEKLDELKEAVLLGALIEMDGDILTRGIGKKLEVQGRINSASRLLS